MKRQWQLFPLAIFVMTLAASGCNRKTAGDGASNAGPTKPAAKLVINFNTARLGELVDCGCPSHPRGGLARWAEVVKGLSSANPDQFLAIDGGDAFFPNSGPNIATDEQKKLAIVLAKSYALANIGAINVGPMDLAAGLPFLRDQISKAGTTKLPLISANVVDPATGKPAFPASREFKVGDRNVCVYGISEVLNGDASVQVSDPTAAAKAQIAALRSQCDLLIGLYAMPIHTASELSRQAPGADIIIVSHPSSSPAPKPLVLGNTALFQAGSRGMYTGRLDVTIQETKPASGPAVSAEERAEIESQLSRVVAQKKLLEGDISNDPQLTPILKKAQEDEKSLREKLGEASSAFDYESSIISLDLNMTEEPQIAAWVKETGVQPKSHGKPAAPLPMVESTPVTPGK